jgi:hypothetical protein
MSISTAEARQRIQFIAKARQHVHFNRKSTPACPIQPQKHASMSISIAEARQRIQFIAKAAE